MRIAIIGAGLAGLAAARALADCGHAIRLFDKGRGPGGRLSTRRMETPVGLARFDHGAPFLSPAAGAFRQAANAWVAAGVAAPWAGRFRIAPADGGPLQHAPDGLRLVGTPAMNALIRHFANDLDVRWAARVTAIEGGPGAWTLALEEGEPEGPFETVLCAIPAEQAAVLLQPVAPQIAAAAGAVRSDPCWTAMLAFDAPVDAGLDGLMLETGALVSLLRNSAKPGRDGPEAWVVHAAPGHSAALLEADPDTVLADLVPRFCAITGAPQPVAAAAHRWRYARVARSAGVPAFWEAQLSLGACGDWCLGPDAGHAFDSGLALASRLSAREA